MYAYKYTGIYKKLMFVHKRKDGHNSKKIDSQADINS